MGEMPRRSSEAYSMPRKRNWKEWLEANPAKVVLGAVAAACTATIAVSNYFHGEEMKIEEQSAATKLEQTKIDFSNRLHDLETRLVSIERRVGTESILDVSALTVTSRQIKSLGSDFIYNDEVHAYLSLPGSTSWKFIETDELGLSKMLSSPAGGTALGQSVLGQVAKQSKLSLWRAEDVFEIASAAAEDSKLSLFPFVAVEVIRNQDFSRLMADVPEILGKLEGIDVEGALDALNKSQTTADSEAKPGEKTALTPGAVARSNEKEEVTGSREKLYEKLTEVYNSDIAGIFLCGQIMQGFVESMEFPGSKFRVLDSEKKANVLYMHMQTIFPGTSKTKKVYWDREVIVIGNSQSTYVVLTSAPSLDQRPSSGPWITAWLAGLRVPLE
jgi:hypothetical protein